MDMRDIEKLENTLRELEEKHKRVRKLLNKIDLMKCRYDYVSSISDLKKIQLYKEYNNSCEINVSEETSLKILELVKSDCMEQMHEAENELEKI